MNKKMLLLSVLVPGTIFASQTSKLDCVVVETTQNLAQFKYSLPTLVLGETAMKNEIVLQAKHNSDFEMRLFADASTNSQQINLSVMNTKTDSEAFASANGNNLITFLKVKDEVVSIYCDIGK